MKGVVLGGTRSGVGKTVATLATIRALTAEGYDVQPAKAGPDFIDPSHHAAVAGRPSRTLDPWLQGTAGMRRNYARGEGDVCVVEGVMGLYDGDCASTARVAATLDLPVVLVVDAAAGMESVAATALGFREYASRAGEGEGADVVGVLAQRAHGGRHAEGIRNALPDELTYFGRVPPTEELAIPDRHLGLHSGTEAPVPEAALEEAASGVATERLVAAAREPAPPSDMSAQERPGSGAGHGSDSGDDSDHPERPRVAVARDSAFRFVYPATMERLRARATVETFAPAAGDDLPECDGVYLPGGYPELNLDALAGGPALSTIAARASEGLPVLGECGGLMALADSLTTTDGDTAEMAGVLPARVEMCERYQALDHVALTAREDTLTATAGSDLRGHEFHYSRADVDADARFAFEMDRGDGIDGTHDGLTEYRTLGTYSHVHAESGAFDRFLDALVD